MRARGMTWWALILMVALAACASSQGGGNAVRTRVPITELKSVVGKWEGLLSGLSTTPSRDQDFVEVSINPDATYEAKAFRTVGVLQGRGTLELSNGSLVLRGQRGTTGTGELFTIGSGKVLQIEATSADGRRVSARLSPRS